MLQEGDAAGGGRVANHARDVIVGDDVGVVERRLADAGGWLFTRRFWRHDARAQNLGARVRARRPLEADRDDNRRHADVPGHRSWQPGEHHHQLLVAPAARGLRGQQQHGPRGWRRLGATALAQRTPTVGREGNDFRTGQGHLQRARRAQSVPQDFAEREHAAARRSQLLVPGAGQQLRAALQPLPRVQALRRLLQVDARGDGEEGRNQDSVGSRYRGLCRAERHPGQHPRCLQGLWTFYFVFTRFCSFVR